MKTPESGPIIAGTGGSGRNHPTGPACRLIEILNANDEKLLPFVKVQSV